MTIRLVPFTDEHLGPMAATIRDPDILRFTSTPDPTPADWLTTWRTQFDGETKVSWAIVDDASPDHDGFVGYAVAFDIDREAAELELGYATSPWARGHGVATATLALLTDWALDQGMHRLALLISPENTGSQRVAEKCGYVFEGAREDLQHWQRVSTSSTSAG